MNFCVNCFHFEMKNRFSNVMTTTSAITKIIENEINSKLKIHLKQKANRFVLSEQRRQRIVSICFMIYGRFFFPSFLCPFLRDSRSLRSSLINNKFPFDLISIRCHFVFANTQKKSKQQDETVFTSLNSFWCLWNFVCIQHIEWHHMQLCCRCLLSVSSCSLLILVSVSHSSTFLCRFLSEIYFALSHFHLSFHQQVFNSPLITSFFFALDEKIKKRFFILILHCALMILVSISVQT